MWYKALPFIQFNVHGSLFLSQCGGMPLYVYAHIHTTVTVCVPATTCVTVNACATVNTCVTVNTCISPLKCVTVVSAIIDQPDIVDMRFFTCITVFYKFYKSTTYEIVQ